MKAQFDVDDALWRKIRLDAVTQGKTMGELVEPVLMSHWGVTKGRSVERKQAVVTSQPVEPAPVSVAPSKPVVVATVAVKQLVSEFLCKVCGKPTKGEFLCPTCKKL